ncbi:uncharacterized protein [Euphorbia lathyris]|uniref:uncharacterized protein n=1 Tax=Euphorbia lathyris TaxID=212925 RepID=UPI003313382C
MKENVPREDNQDAEGANRKECGEASSSGAAQIFEFLAKFQSLAKELGSKVNEMYCMLKEANVVFGEDVTSVQMSNLINNLWSKYTRGNEDPVSQSEGGKEEVVNENKAESKKDSGMTGDVDCDLSSQDSHSYFNSEFFDEIDALVERIKREKKDQRESKTPMKKSEEKYSCPNFNLLSQELPDFVGTEGGSTQAKKFVEKSVGADMKNNSDPEII